MPLYPLDIPPGMYRNGTEYQSQGRWYDANGIRWFTKTIRPVGGWLKVFAETVDGPGRGMRAWRRNTGVTYCAIGTPNKLWVMDSDTLTDITPDFFPPGVLDTVAGMGFGSGRFGLGPFGSSGGGGSRTSATMWSLAPWGDHLLAMATHDNILYEWDGTLASPAVAVANAPTGTSFFVTEEQTVVVLGANDEQRTAQWCAVQNDTLWAPAPDNIAGNHKLDTDGVLVVGIPARGGYLILTTVDAHLMTYVGLPRVYTFERIDTGCGIFGVRAACAFQNGNVAWMGSDQFFLFDGASVMPLPCDVQDYIFSDFNFDQSAKVYAATTQIFGELTWHYCSADSLVVNRSVTWNFIENHWAINGQPPRSSWQDAGAFAFPMGVATDGTIYNQEDGWTADGVSRVGTLYARSGPVEVGRGDQVIYATKVIPDEVSPGAWTLALKTRFAPEDAEVTYGPYTLATFTDVRAAGRQMATEIRNANDSDSRVGRFRIEGKTGGGR